MTSMLKSVWVCLCVHGHVFNPKSARFIFVICYNCFNAFVFVFVVVVVKKFTGFIGLARFSRDDFTASQIWIPISKFI